MTFPFLLSRDILDKNPVSTLTLLIGRQEGHTARNSDPALTNWLGST